MEALLNTFRSPTSELQLENFQATLNIVQKIKRGSAENNDGIALFVNEAIDLLWTHLNAVLPTTECQLMCATCFFTLLSIHKDITKPLQDADFKITRYYIEKNLDKDLTKQDMFVVISIIYGMYQSPFISTTSDNATIRNILETSFEVLVLCSYEYTEFTFITFKTLQNIRKLLQSNFKDVLLRKQKHSMLLNITSHNWENPITGVRDLNKIVFGLCIDVGNLMIETELNYHQLMHEINSFPWNKAKYLMLSEIIVRESKMASTLLNNNSDWLNGLITSLTTSSLVSAGADMYLAVMKKTNTDTEWCLIFLEAVLDIFKGSDFKMVENFNNYWCLNTLKQFPNILNILHSKLGSAQSNNAVYANLSVLRQGNKLGLVNKLWPNSKTNIDNSNISEHKNISFLKTIVGGLEHVNTNIRIQTFEIICIAHNNALPTKVELDLVLKFIHENANSDSTVLRLSILNNIKLFFTRLHISTMNKMKCTTGAHDLQHLLEFCASFQKNLKFHFRIHGNYQRSITMTKLCNVFLSSFSKPLQRKRRLAPTNVGEFTLKGWLTEQQMWLLNDEKFVQNLLRHMDDPADDVRDTVSDILLSHYSDYFSSPKTQELLDNSLKNIRSKYFYEVYSGNCGLKLVSNLIVTHSYDDLQFSRIDELFMYFFDNLITELSCENDILQSIETGKPLHSLMSILRNILQVCLKNSYPLNEILTDDMKKTLIDKIGAIPKFYSLEDDFNCSPDFSEMSAMVEQLISRSACKMQTEDGDVKISDVHQIVSNCIWLNLKACCDLLCILVKCMDRDVDLNHSDLCLHIIANILETSRHKGAIEAGGVALGQSIKHLTSLSQTLELSRLPMKLLKEKLGDLIHGNKMGSIRRRGAGLSIMLHRIVSNDMDKEKPLFHHAINMLLAASRTSDSEAKQETGNERDIPKAIYIHLMTKIVADSSLASDVMYYSASLAEVAFSNLTSQQWQIRNAALQLYGALVPKLIGQKKSATSEEGSAATVGCDELRTHSPKLWTYIKRQLDCREKTDDIVQAHSNLVPVLNILASTAKKYNFSVDKGDNSESDILFENLMRLLNSPIHSVRRLAAKSIERMYTLPMITAFILETKSVSENLLHGFLILIRFFKKRFADHVDQEAKFIALEKHFDNVMNAKKYSFVVKSVYDETFFNATSEPIETVQKIINVLNMHRSIPGTFMWANIVIEKCIKYCSCKDIPIIMKKLQDLSDFETYCEFALKRLHQDENLTATYLIQLITIFIENDLKFEYGGIWKILYEISTKDEIHYDDNILPMAFEYLETQNYVVPNKIQYFIPFVAKVFTVCSSERVNILRFSSLINSLTNYEKVDVNMRLMAVIANNSLGLAIYSLPQEVKINVLKSALNALQDDDEDVRLEAAHFYSNAMKTSFIYQPFICLQYILDYKFLDVIFKGSSEYIVKLIENLLKSLDIDKGKEERSYNPFVIEMRNIYAEPQFFSHYIHLLRPKIVSHTNRCINII